MIPKTAAKQIYKIGLFFQIRIIAKKAAKNNNSALPVKAIFAICSPANKISANTAGLIPPKIF